ncbi:hypothetical protein TNCV_2396451 [Trichonephila clavipes]|uniref:Uncharacterized protein n=1 Tax=Trichonephila clavipes TaxID=2585209 RepID=A0A8X6SRX1_TRICX|nr:hypothetical protein TNCV_2396451 [Trichonephila clavipes]
MSKEALKALNRKRGAIKAQLTRIKDFMNKPDEKDKTHLESILDTLKSIRIKLSEIRNEYYEVVKDDSDLEALKALNRKRGAKNPHLTIIKDFMNKPDEKDKTHLESILDTLKSIRIKLSEIRNEYYEVVKR